MGKVKKTGAVKRTRRTAAAMRAKTRAVITVVKRPASKTVRVKAGKAPRNTAGKALGRTSIKPPAPTFRIRELDPVKKCGRRTTVQVLYRIDEVNGGVVRSHLVFFDRHGWYCEHGPACIAVSQAQREARKLGVSALLHGPTHNGRMRA